MLEDFSFLAPLLDRLSRAEAATGRLPFVTLTYAQSLDGCIALNPGGPCLLSSPPSLVLTHFLRARHDALLVGVNTILTDDPQLTVRHCEGRDPQPVVLDSQLRTPLDCRLLRRGKKPPILIATLESDPGKRQALEERGAKIVLVEAGDDGCVALEESLQALARMGIRTLMVEGGARVIGAFLARRRVDYCVITIAPRILGGLRAVDPLSRLAAWTPLTLDDCRYHALGPDLIAFGPVGFS